MADCEDSDTWKEFSKKISPLSSRERRKVSFIKQRFSSFGHRKLIRDMLHARGEYYHQGGSHGAVVGAGVSLSSSTIGIIDKNMVRKISKGKIAIDGSIDLHGNTQKQAFEALVEFLRSAYESDKRTLLVITGKGVTGEGAIKRALPVWLESATLSEIVSSYSLAGRNHGGQGAYYVRLRRKTVG